MQFKAVDFFSIPCSPDQGHGRSSVGNSRKVRTFQLFLRTYVYIPEKGMFEPVPGMPHHLPHQICQALHALQQIDTKGSSLYALCPLAEFSTNFIALGLITYTTSASLNVYSFLLYSDSRSSLPMAIQPLDGPSLEIACKSTWEVALAWLQAQIQCLVHRGQVFLQIDMTNGLQVQTGRTLMWFRGRCATTWCKLMAMKKPLYRLGIPCT